jgi:hypothetical protein
MANEGMKDFEGFAEVSDELPAALAAASPHRLPPDLRARVLRAAEARAGRAPRFGLAKLGWARATVVGVVFAAIVGLVLWNVQLQQGLAQERSLLQQLRDNAREAVIFEVVDSAGSQRANLRGQGPQRPGEDPPYGKLYTNSNRTEIVMMGGRLPAPGATDEYHLYLTDRPGATVAAGTLRVDATGFGYLVYDTGTRGPVFAAARLYLQPAGASAPGGTLVLAFEAR